MVVEIRSEQDLIQLNGHVAIADVPSDSFEKIGAGRYRFEIPRLALVMEIDRLRRERAELVGELAVFSSLPGVKSALSIADLNVSSARARRERAKLLTERSHAETLDFMGVIEELCQRVLAADREGEPALDLRTLPRPTADGSFLVEGFPLLRRNPMIIFGDGGTAKSYLGLFLAGRLAEQGTRVALFDWELAAEDHRDRLERLFGRSMPKVIYARCVRPLVYEIDRLQRICRDEGIEYTFYDSVAFACDGAPEAAEVAGRYFGAVREIGGGSLHIAHINKSDNADKKPFGSTFWHNGARSTWFIKAGDQIGGSSSLNIGLFNRKANLGPLRRPVGFRIEFGEDSATFCRADVAEEPELAGTMYIKDKLYAALSKGPMNIDELARQIDEKPESIKSKARTYKDRFITLNDGRIALRQKGGD